MSTLRLWLRFLVWARASIRITIRLIMSAAPAALACRLWGDSIPTGMTVLVCIVLALSVTKPVWHDASRRSTQIKGVTETQVSTLRTAADNQGGAR